MPMLLLTLLLAACSGDEEPAAPTPPVEPPPSDPAVVPPVPADGKAAEALTPAEMAAAASRTRIGARHILVSYQGALGADKALRRTKEEARARAEERLGRVRGGEDFASVARTSSDDPGSKVGGGDLGAFDKGAMNPAFEQAAFALREGEISSVVETPFGFHVIQRYALNEIHVAHVLVQWSGVEKTAKRTKEEARARAEEARTRLQGGEPVDQVAKSYSDGPTGARGGDLGWFQKGQMMPAFDAAAFKLQPGQVSDVVESPLGYHVIIRLE